MIEVKKLTKRFKNGKGLFDINFQVKSGEVFGFIGPNGAGKSTTIRHLMGFLKPDIGESKINDLDCWSESTKIKKSLGYLPGEIVFPSSMSAADFIKLQEGLYNIKNRSRTKELIERFQLNIHIPIKNMSKGMKQKLAIVVAFMSDPDILILDEPSTGLDPLMQKELINLLIEEKTEGKTIFLSSHIFEEIENIADKICIIKNGKILKNQGIKDVHDQMKQTLIIRFTDNTDLTSFAIPHQRKEDGSFHIEIKNNENEVIRELAKYQIQSLEMKRTTLSEVFEQYYMGGD
ncbi:ABC transporter ATP-binding protein [Virgibacillus sp. Bac330]|uniref:ABC transporter ATP-binding protein n=1 Tax=Virgibacillus sp. Bac330 TaxID=2419841 RepID=UPI000EF46D97|nr:ABC transporter ATP-binding protein [Virgibacillus sp. Bac330]